VLLARRHDLVGLFQRAAERFFHVDMHPPLGRGHDHVAVLIQPTRRDRHDVRFRLVQHLAVIGVPAAHVQPLLSRRQSRLVRIGHRHDLAIRHLQPNRVDPMPIVPAPRMPDHADPIPGLHGENLRRVELV
jgi:hypothetical protein